MSLTIIFNSGGIITPKTLLASATGSPLIVRQINLIRSASATGTATITRIINLIRLASATGTATLLKVRAKVMLAIATGSATIVRRISLIRLVVVTGTAYIVINALLTFVLGKFVTYVDKMLRRTTAGSRNLTTKVSVDQPALTKDNDRLTKDL
jgi:hypothetical protein